MATIKFKMFPVHKGEFALYLPSFHGTKEFSWDISSLDKGSSDIHAKILNDLKPFWPTDGINSGIRYKCDMLKFVGDYFKKNGIDFDEFGGLAPTRLNKYLGYEFGTLYVLTILIKVRTDYPNDILVKKIVDREDFYEKFGPMLSKVYKKYPSLCTPILFDLNIVLPDNKFMEYINMDEADYDNDVNLNGDGNDEKADEFNAWLIKWTSRGTEKDKMRVKNWFEKNKSHKQIFAEIHKVVGNREKFNGRLALFVERLANNENLDSFLERSGFATKEDLFMAYFEKLTDFDEETKKKFIHKYLLKD